MCWRTGSALATFKKKIKIKEKSKKKIEFCFESCLRRPYALTHRIYDGNFQTYVDLVR